LINAVHQLLLSRLDATPAPTVRLRELLAHPESSWRPLLANGVLAEADTPDEIEFAPARFLNVRMVGTSYFGFDTAEDYPTPQPLSREDITEYRVVVPALLAHLRDLNAIDGRNPNESPAPSGLHFLGRKAMAAGTVQVWLGLALRTPESIVGQISLLSTTDAALRHVVVFPLWPQLVPATTTALATAGVLLADLDSTALAIRWPTTLTSDPFPRDPDYGLRWNGATWRIDFLGEHTSVHDSLGITYIALLMTTPDGAWTPLDLQNGRRTTDAGSAEAVIQGLSVRSHTQSDLAKASPQQARAAHQKRRAYDLEIEKLREQGRGTEADELQKDADVFASENSQVLGMQGRARFEGQKENARLAVRGNVERALKAIDQAHPLIGRVFRARIHRGNPLSFTPQMGECWQVRLPTKIRTSRSKSRK
jgi:hypothetical protein